MRAAAQFSGDLARVARRVATRTARDQASVRSRYATEGTPGVQSCRASPGRADSALLWKPFRSRAACRDGTQRCSGQTHYRDPACARSGDHEPAKNGGTRHAAQGRFQRDHPDCSGRRAHAKRTQSVNGSFVRPNREPRIDRGSRVHSALMLPVAALTLFLLLVGCSDRGNAVSGTIEVDEAHVGPRSGGRVEKILAWEGDRLHEGQVIVQLDASELRARRDLASAQIDTAAHDADSQEAQLVFLRDDARRQKDLLNRRVVSATDAERSDSAAKAQEKNVAAAKMRVAQARAQQADIDSQLAEMQIIAPADSILEVLSVKVGDVLPANREAATLLLTGHLWVRVYVPESWLGLIKLGEHVRVRVDSFPHTDFDGVVEQISRQAEFTPRNVQTVADRIKQVFGVKIRLPADDDRLRAGMAADVYFPNVK